MSHNSTLTSGFSLVELMCVLVIVAILGAMALPAYRAQMISVKRSSGQSFLLAILARQEQYFINNKRYAASLNQLGYETSPFAIDRSGNTVAVDSTDRIYLLGISQVSPPEAPTSFSLHATPELGQRADSRCGTLTLTSTGIKSASAGLVSQCW